MLEIAAKQRPRRILLHLGAGPRSIRGRGGKVGGVMLQVDACPRLAAERGGADGALCCTEEQIDTLARQACPRSVGRGRHLGTSFRVPGIDHQ